MTVSGVKSPLYRLLCRPDIGSPLPVWSHRWRRWWSWKLAAKLAQSEAICCRRDQYVMESRHMACSHESLTPLTHITANDWRISVHQVFMCPQRLHLLMVPQWYLMLFDINECWTTWWKIIQIFIPTRLKGNHSMAFNELCVIRSEKSCRGGCCVTDSLRINNSHCLVSINFLYVRWI